MSNSSIWPIDRSLSGATTPGQSGPESDSNEEILCIPQSSFTTGVSSSDCFMSYTERSLGVGLTSLKRCSRCILQPQPTGLYFIMRWCCDKYMIDVSTYRISIVCLVIFVLNIMFSMWDMNYLEKGRQGKNLSKHTQFVYRFCLNDRRRGILLYRYEEVF